MRTVLVVFVLLSLTLTLHAQAPPAPCTTPVPPPAVNNLVAVRTGESVAVDWQIANPSATVCPATRFYVEASRYGREIIERDTEQRTITLTLPIAGGPIGAPWRVSVRAFNSEGMSAQRSIYLDTPAPSCLAEPPPVSSVSAIVVNRLATIDWMTPSDCRLTGFLITGSASPDGPVLGSVRVPHPNVRRWTTPITSGTWYIKVYAEWGGRFLVADAPMTTVVVP